MVRSFSGRSRWWISIVQVVLLLATITLPAFASDPPPVSDAQLVQVLQTYGIIQGDESGNLNLGGSIKRSEMVTIMIRAQGLKDDAQLYKGLGLFSDTKGHWAEGFIGLASRKGLVKGDGNGHFRPDDSINYAEALTLLLRVLGKEPTGGEWPISVLMAAAQLNLVPPGVNAGNIRDNAPRGAIFQALAKGLITIKTATGKTLLAEYVIKTSPEITVDQVTSPTTDSKMLISGRSPNAIQVLLNGIPASLANGQFSGSVDLTYGTNSLTIIARDIAGNESAPRIVSVVRNANVAKIDVTGSETVVVGETTAIKAVAYDGANAVVANAPITATISGNIGSYDVITGVFTAGNLAGNGSITFKVGDLSKTFNLSVTGPSSKVAGMVIISPSVPLNPNVPGTIEIHTLDSNGNIVTEDNGRQIGMVGSGIAGITITPTIAKTVGGIAKFTFSGATGGVATLTASSGSLPGTGGQVTVATQIRVVLTTSLSSLVATGASSTMIRAQMMNSDGVLQVNNSGSDIIVQLRRSGIGDGTLSPNVLTIKQGRATSEGLDAQYTAGFTSGTLYLNGDILSGSAYTVLGTTVTLTSYFTGGGGGGGGGSTAGPAYRLQFLGSIGPEMPGPTPTELVFRVVDYNGTSVTTGNYPFALKVTTSNNDPIGANGLPQGVTLTLGSTTLVPTGSAAGVIGTTVNGLARVRVAYNKAGTVRIEPVGVAATNTGYDDLGNLVSTSLYSTGLSLLAHEIKFSPGAAAWTKLKLLASYSNTTTGITYTGATEAPVPINSTLTLTAGLYDNNDGLVPDGQAIAVSLYKDGGATPIATKSVTSGTVDFAVTAPTAAATVVYTIKANPGTPQEVAGLNSVNLRAQSSPIASTPVIYAVRGATSSGDAHDAYKVSISDTYLQLVVQSGATGYGVVKVYRSSTSTPIFTTPVSDLSALTVVNVPKNLLVNQDTYRLAVDNGAGNSPQSAPTASVVLNSAITVGLYSATYDAVTHKLTINTNYSGAATINPTKLTLTAPGGAVFTPSVGKVDGNGTFVIDLTSDPNRTSILEHSSVFAGDVRLAAPQDGWYERSDGGEATPVTNSITVGPFATVTNAYLDMTNRRLIIDTVGATGGYFDLSKISVPTILTLDNTNYSIRADGTVSGRYVISLPSNLSPATVTALNSFNGSIAADLGWYYSGYNPYNKVAADDDGAQVYGLISVGGANYNRTTFVLRITGSGFLTADSSGIDSTKITVSNVAPGAALASATLVGSGNIVQIVNDSTIQITLGATDQAKMVQMSGSLVFLRAALTWLVDHGTRNAPPITGYQSGVGFSTN